MPNPFQQALGPSIYDQNRVPGMLAPGNLDLTKRPVVKNPDGSISTVRSISFSLGPGREVLIPTVVGNKVLDNQSAVQHFFHTGQHLGIFNSPDTATAYAMSLHEGQAVQYGQGN